MNFFIERKVVSFLLAIFLGLYGIFAYISTPKTLQPEITIPMATITTILPGANPADTETLLTNPLEKEISTLDEIKKLTSSSGIGISLIMVEFEAEADFDESMQELKNRVESATADLPEDASTPLVSKIEVDEIPVIAFSISGTASKIELSKIVDEITEELEKIKGVGKVNVVGKSEKNIEILVDPDKAGNYGLELQTISNLIKFSHSSTPIGIINIDHENYSIRIDNQYKSSQEILSTPLFSIQDGNILKISDIATANEKYISPGTVSKLSTNGKEATNAITLQIFKKKNSNSIEVADLAKEKIETYKKNLSKNIKIGISNDNSLFIRQDLGILTTNGIQTMIIIAIILFLAMGLVEGLIAAMSVPLSLLSAIIIINALGFTINSLTLFSLVIALGLIVDNAIVIMEGIHQKMKEGMSSDNAAIRTIKDYKWPLIAGTLTTIFAFFPMLLVGGIVGQFMRTLPITISAALIASLIIPFTIGASITAKFMAKRQNKLKKSILEPIFKAVGQKFHNLIYKILGSKPAKFLVIITTTVLFILSISLPISGVLKTELFPKTDTFFFIINLETPAGTTLAETSKIVEEVEEKLYRIKEIDNFLTLIGTNKSQATTDLIAMGESLQTNLANITVNLVPKKEREKKSYEISEQVRNSLKDYKKAKIIVKELSEGPPQEAPITVRLAGKNLENLKLTSEKVKSLLEKIEGTRDVKIDTNQGSKEFKFIFNREKLSSYGLTPAQAGLLARNILQTIKATSITIEGEDINILVKYDLQTKDKITEIDINQIENFAIPIGKGQTISLNQIATYQLTDSLSTINHEDEKRIIKITSEIKGEHTASEITKLIEKEISKADLPKDIDVSLGGDLEDINESFNDLFKSMILAVILISVTLIMVFNSIRQTIIIMMTLPLALIAVFPGLLITGLNFSFPAFLGIVALAGVVVNDAIVLLDKINKNLAEGMEYKEAIAESTKSRLEPIFMTTITTVAGILPLALVNEFWKGLGLALVFGLSASTISTLTIIPTIYAVLERKKRKEA